MPSALLMEGNDLEAAIHLPDRSRIVCPGNWEKAWDGTQAEARHRIETPAPAEVVTTCRTGAEPGEIVLTQRASLAGATGLAGVEWVLDGIPLECNIIIPGYSGIKMTQTTPGARHDFEYPISWEAQLVIIEGEGEGYYVWAEDAAGWYKQLSVERTESGWRLGFATQTNAPFAAQSECVSPPWHIAPYTGDWRVAARQYRDWMWNAFKPVPVSRQHPAWAGDTRCCVIMGLDVSLLEGLAQRLDPAQTMLYLPDWRRAGYDRDYPSYDAIVPELAPFVARETILPGAWHPLRAILDDYTGRPFVLTLIVDAAGSFNCDWAHWAEPVLKKFN